MIKLGIIGTGRIARRFASEAGTTEDLMIQAVYNPHIDSAKRFAGEYGIPEYTDSLEELEKQIDAVYIASPHETHYGYASRMLGAHIHVLCEKPLTLCGKEAKELFSLADKNNCILMEAVKTAYCPGFIAMLETAKSGVIGEIRDVEACFCKLTSTNTRELSDHIYGGSFTELGTYPMLPIFKLLGTEYREVHFRTLQTEHGLDAYTKAEFVYGEALGLSKTGLLVKSEGQLIVAGTQGYLLAKSPWWLTREFEVRFEDPSKKEIRHCEFAGMGLCYELDAFIKAIGGENSIKVTPEESIRMAETMERFLKETSRSGNILNGRRT